MKFLIAPGKYHDSSISSKLVGQAIYSGISRALPDAKIVTMPVTDSKYGMPALVAHTIGGRWVDLPFFDAFWQNKMGKYLLTNIDSQDTAIIDTEQIVGPELAIAKNRNDLFHATSYGIGEFILDAVTSGYREIVVSLGTSETFDGGLGALQALGAKIYDEGGDLIPEGENPLINGYEVDLDDVYRLLHKTRITLLLSYSSNVQLEGQRDYLSETQKDFLEDNLLFITEKINQKYNLDIHPMPHSGSIKTLAGAFAMIRAHISRSSFEWVANVTGMDETIRSVDVMVTATDEVSAESMHDEILFHLSKIAGYSKMPTFVLCNNFIDDFEDYEQLFTGIFSTQMSNYANDNNDEQMLFEHYESIANQLARTLDAFHNGNH
ncbi:glycerate kinase [Companilactobacillus versmoldensis]|uniref:Glycerate kinase n=1 Tax=Companilactobacillus versmoldensis DSM 14857 = KCTC 3814 TaxID=1423815 RepID=A0A0R1SD57_9LACO|nr:glycerate kinase [Companilactobacillus versmoldensis]KRL67073.1 glycerate kinase [Companilactobacillus versmoldensis DSM 14857 = KCTC 3814]